MGCVGLGIWLSDLVDLVWCFVLLCFVVIFWVCCLCCFFGCGLDRICLVVGCWCSSDLCFWVFVCFVFYCCVIVFRCFGFDLVLVGWIMIWWFVCLYMLVCFVA